MYNNYHWASWLLNVLQLSFLSDNVTNCLQAYRACSTVCNSCVNAGADTTTWRSSFSTRMLLIGTYTDVSEQQIWMWQLTQNISVDPSLTRCMLSVTFISLSCHCTTDYFHILKIITTTILLGRQCTVVTGGLIKCSWCFLGRPFTVVTGGLIKC